MMLLIEPLLVAALGEAGAAIAAVISGILAIMTMIKALHFLRQAMRK